jgi:hypothetical protein
MVMRGCNGSPTGVELQYDRDGRIAPIRSARQNFRLLNSAKFLLFPAIRPLNCSG